ncbi:MAG TPA: ATP:cob(I)alamin adenosyltransferase, partial [Gemmatimonadales bacterium]|nr:ATP:cob(I)alamin adenosyltransferase [Gemmatimonadales bacterium]
MKIYTRTGDAGETSLFDGTRVKKDDPRVDAYGEVDELNAWLGLVRASAVDAQLDAELAHIQRDLFALGAQLADPA